jgi:PhzF family phenazine biosynthesis protein
MRLFQIDSFTETVFRGNPAGVCLLDAPGESAVASAWMQNLAHEMNASETAFCWPLVGDSNLNRSEPQYAIRYFTPTQEVPLCGHATLASAFALLHLQASRQPDKTKDIPFTSVTFIAKGDTLKCQAIGDRTIVMDFPAHPLK